MQRDQKNSLKTFLRAASSSQLFKYENELKLSKISSSYVLFTQTNNI